MPHLFDLPDWIALFPLVVFSAVLFKVRSPTSRWWLAFFPAIAFDQLGLAAFGSMLEPLKFAILIAAIACLYSLSIPKIGMAEIAFIAYFILRDFSALLLDGTGGGVAIRYSLQAYIIYSGIFLLAAMITCRFDARNLVRIADRGVFIALAITLAIAAYQLVAYRFGLPINGVSNAYDAVRGELKWAAFNAEGMTTFRPYALFGEPKFMASFAIAAYAFSVFCLSVGIFRMKRFLAYLLLSGAVIAISASTSAFVSFVAVTLIGLAQRRSLAFGFGVAIVSLVVVTLAQNFYLDVGLLYEYRLLERLSTAERALEFHELKYLETWLSDGLSALVGVGYSGFARDLVESFRLIPNSAVIFYGYSGGILLLILYAAIFLKEFRSSKHLLVFLVAASVFTTPTTLFVIYLLSSIAFRFLTESRRATASHVLAGAKDISQPRSFTRLS